MCSRRCVRYLPVFLITLETGNFLENIRTVMINLLLTITDEAFLQDVLVILKRMLQNY